jgi:hypothetical protein
MTDREMDPRPDLHDADVDDDKSFAERVKEKLEDMVDDEPDAEDDTPKINPVTGQQRDL